MSSFFRFVKRSTSFFVNMLSLREPVSSMPDAGRVIIAADFREMVFLQQVLILISTWSMRQRRSFLMQSFTAWILAQLPLCINRSVAFYRSYPHIAHDRVVFDVELVSDGKTVFHEHATLYPFTADSFLQRHSAAGFSLAGCMPVLIKHRSAENTMPGWSWNM